MTARYRIIVIRAGCERSYPARDFQSALDIARGIARDERHNPVYIEHVEYGTRQDVREAYGI